MTKETVEEIKQDIEDNGSLGYDHLIVTVILEDNTQYKASCDDFNSFLAIIGDSLRLSFNANQDIYIDLNSIKCIYSEVFN